MKTIATICARGGSIGLPKKNICTLNGKPLIAHTIEQAMACDLIDDVVVSTDDLEIAAIAKQYGAQVPFIRPAHLATSEAGKLPVIEHCIKSLEDAGAQIATIIDLQPTSPLREIEDIKRCYNLLDQETDVVFSVCETDKNPYFSLVEVNTQGNAIRSKTLNTDVLRRQDAPKVYALNGAIYVWHRRSLSLGLWGGRSKCYIMPKIRSIDIDDDIDLRFAQLMYERK